MMARATYSGAHRSRDSLDPMDVFGHKYTMPGACGTVQSEPASTEGERGQQRLEDERVGAVEVGYGASAVEPVELAAVSRHEQHVLALRAVAAGHCAATLLPLFAGDGARGVRADAKLLRALVGVGVGAGCRGSSHHSDLGGAGAGGVADGHPAIGIPGNEPERWALEAETGLRALVDGLAARQVRRRPPAYGVSPPRRH